MPGYPCCCEAVESCDCCDDGGPSSMWLRISGVDEDPGFCTAGECDDFNADWEVPRSGSAVCNWTTVPFPTAPNDCVGAVGFSVGLVCTGGGDVEITVTMGTTNGGVTYRTTIMSEPITCSGLIFSFTSTHEIAEDLTSCDVSGATFELWGSTPP